jgi:hypothetical protein
MSLIVELPLNNLSYGQVGYNLLRELFKREKTVGVFPIGNTDLSAYEPSKEFMAWLQESVNRRFDFLKRETPSLKLWHIQGSENLRTPNQILATFYECSEPSNYEKRICALQKKTLFSSNDSANHFKSGGLDNVGTFSCGFDPDFHLTGKKYQDDKTVFSLIAKFEHRKHTAQIITAWCKKYGNNSRYALNLLVNNPFFDADTNQRLLSNAMMGKRFWNVSVLPHLRTNKEVNELINASDVDLSGLSGGEGWNLGSFHATALGKWATVMNHTAHKDWATAENSILVEPDGRMSVYDGVFFKPESPTNHGQFYTLSEENMINAMEIAEKKAKTPNPNGQNLQKTHSWAKAVDNILAQIA